MLRPNSAKDSLYSTASASGRSKLAQKRAAVVANSRFGMAIMGRRARPDKPAHGSRVPGIGRPEGDARSMTDKALLDFMVIMAVAHKRSIDLDEAETGHACG